ncbi:hypothetical protein HL667_03525 [Bradyrhizobium sp. 83012]|uniref:Uncharacterized protein n=1 Tax=Bradyrhizobium aeschynomenes TaxID=2734909 RepID=A0ABX2C731_9BRAD|nr:hypothetical protein [Bradyrhizobium aeschynomenes]
MGEAKRRKQQDPSYGKPLRGLIMTSEIVKRPEGTRVSASIEPQQLRYALLFWDKIVWPSNNLIFAAGNEDSAFLETTKILERPRHEFASTTDPAEPFVRSQLQEFQKRDNKDREVWDLCQNTAVLLASVSDATHPGGMGIELIRAIPVPDKDVPLNEILEFKRKRHAEFVALRAEIDTLAARLNSTSNPDTDLQQLIKHIDKACADALRVSSEWQFPVRLSNKKMALDLKPFELIAGGLGGLLGADYFNMSTSQEILAGIVGTAAAAKSIVKFTSDIGLQSIRRPRSPFSYIAYAHSELF